MKKGLKVFLTILGILLALILMVLLVFYNLYGDILRAALSVEPVGPGLYALEFRGDYGFDQYIEEGGGASTEEYADYILNFLSKGLHDPDRDAPEDTHGCSSLAAVTPDGLPIYGRNFDWEQSSAMIIHTIPDDGYESISTAAMDFLGFGFGWKPEGIVNQIMSLATVYVPVDGMNEKGLYVADLLAGDNIATHQDTGKPDLTTTAAIRMILDHAATCEEAIALLEEIDWHSDIGMAHHLAMADAGGRSVVIEYVKDEMIVTDTPVVTNHYLSDTVKNGLGSYDSHVRYEILDKTNAEKEGVFSPDEMRDAMKSVSQSIVSGDYKITQWSCVYQPEQLSVRLYWAENYEESFLLSMKDRKWLRKE